MNFAHVFLQLNSGDVFVTARKAAKLYVPMLLFNVQLQHCLFHCFKFAMVTINEEAHMLSPRVSQHPTFPF